MGNFAQVALGFVVLLLAVGGLLYMFYARTNAVEKTGYGSLIMLVIISFMIPVLWIMENANQLDATSQQHITAVQRGLALYAQYCIDNCYTIKDGKVLNPKYNGYTIDQLNQMKDTDITRIISAGQYAPGALVPSNENLITRSQRYGGALADTDVDYLLQFIRSADPEYLSKNGYSGASAVNGFNQLPSYLQTNSPSSYSTAVALGSVGQFGPAVDMSKDKHVILRIAQTSATQQCDSGCFVPLNVKVKVGTTITWVNNSKVAHTVTALIGQSTASPKIAKDIFDSGISNLIQPGQKFTYTVTQAAYNFNPNHTVVYYCQVHPNYMFAELTIVQ
jgi:plastocyanin/mono/diheme cytochrome c family protein